MERGGAGETLGALEPPWGGQREGERGSGRAAEGLSSPERCMCVAAVEGNEEEKDREEREDCGWASLA